MRPQANQEISGPATAFPAAAGATIENATGTERKPMKITVERGAFLKALSHVQSVVERRNTIPILSNVLLEADRGSLSLTATDMEIAIVEKVAADVAKPGALTAPAHTLYDIVRKLPEGAEVELGFGNEGQRLTLASGRSRFTLSVLPRDEFPAMLGGAFPHSFEIPAPELRTLIDRSSFAISTEETRYYLNGIFLHVIESGGVSVLRAVATDGHRLARMEIPLPEGHNAFAAVFEGCQARTGFVGFGALVGVIAQHALVGFQRFRLAQLFVAVAHFDQRLGGHRPVG